MKNYTHHYLYAYLLVGNPIFGYTFYWGRVGEVYVPVIAAPHVRATHPIVSKSQMRPQRVPKPTKHRKSFDRRHNHTHLQDRPTNNKVVRSHSRRMH